LAGERADPGERLRWICLSLPDAVEEAMKRGPSFRIGGKIFALLRPDQEGGSALWCKVPEGGQAIAVAAEPGRFFVPPYFGAKGWLGVRLSTDADWGEIEAFVQRSYRLIAKRRKAVG